MRAFPRIQGLATEEPCAVEVYVGHEKFHGAALGDFPGFVQILLRAPGADASAGEKAQPGAGEETEGKVWLLAGTAEAVHGGVGFGEGGWEMGVGRIKNRRVDRGATQRGVVEGEVDKA